MAIAVKLLGTPQALQAGEWQVLPADKRSCLLAYLAFCNDWVGREHVAALFWPDVPDSQARRNLRQLISRTRKLVLAEEFQVEPEQMRWLVETDVARFRQAVGQQDWEGAATCYRGHLCEGLPEAGEGFESWLELERENLQVAWREAVLKRAGELEAERRYPEAADALQRLLSHDTLAEDVLQHYLRCAYLAGRREAALSAFDAFADNLREELDLEPLEETRDLAASIRLAEPLSLDVETEAEPVRVPVAILRPQQFVGREDALQQALTTPSSVVMLSGEAGVGKTRLMEVLAPKAPILRCQEGLQNVPYHPVQGLVRGAGMPAVPPLGSYLEDLARLVPDIAPNITPGPADPHTAKPRLLEALARYLEGIVSEHKGERFQLTFEDLQWADPATLELLVFLSARGTLRLVGSYRDHETTPKLREALQSVRATTLKLEPLDEQAVQALLADLIGQERGPPVFSRWLHHTTGGNPMFLLEILKSMFESGDLWAEGSGWRTSLDDITHDYSEFTPPPVVTDVIQRRLADLPSEVKRVLETAAVVGEGFNPELLGSVSRLSSWVTLEALEEAEARGVVRGERFAHDLIRKSLYHGLSQMRRRLLHAAVADALSGLPETDPAVLAEHWLDAQQPQKAIESWQAGAQLRRERGLYAEAAMLLERALEYASDSETSRRLRVLLGSLYKEMGRHRDAEAMVSDLLGLIDDPPTRAAAHEIQAGNLFYQGKLTEAKTVADAGLAIARTSGDVSLSRRLLVTKAMLLHSVGEHLEALALLEPMVVSARKKAPDLALSQQLSHVAAIYDMLGRHEEALPLHLEALTLAERIGARYAQVDAALNLLYCYMDLGRTEQGITPAEEALELGRYEGTDTLRNNLAAALADLGRLEEATSHYQTLTEESSDPTLLCIAWSRLADLYERVGCSDEVQPALERGIDFAHQTEFAVAQVRAVINTLRLGSSEQTTKIQPLLQQLQPETLPTNLRTELESALASLSA
ncbi:MAG: tetratricopeptide repeat protein [Trueperaceae bacterium]|nr:MAG: tetratricopeptide repeat protein [Trueperaceae bacterium]